MDHDQFVANGTAEKYLLHELSAQEAQEFEAHVFDCAQCAEDLKLTAEFLQRARREARKPPQERREGVGQAGRWWWLAPATVVLMGAAQDNVSVQIPPAEWRAEEYAPLVRGYPGAADGSGVDIATYRFTAHTDSP